VPEPMTAPRMPDFDLDVPWKVSDGVALRPERFGALAYSFDSRRLSFLKSRRLFEVVRSLVEHPSARAACAAAGAGEGELAQLVTALGTLAQTGMIVRRSVA
jgi:putative mycofactocin binding protein MftB